MDHSPRVNRICRVTKGGRQITYVLTVIQQPERARACGSGAKSSSDRRPVDPPPVVELKIYNEDAAKPEDISFSYEANFFLFVTLEAARPQSRGKINHQQQQQHQSTTSSIPILTGMPVSGMAYLDRPAEAGYFIFPDLSVRHEGHYVLSFNLYEETKNECDQDADIKGLAPSGTHSPDSSFDWRLEVKSAPFTVYSAKKFPGLSESTHLSRIVAEQGCRVRIRRDVRMRRRDQKSDEHTTREDYIQRAEEETSHEERTRSQSLSGSSDSSSRFSQSEGANSSFLPNHHHHHHHYHHHHPPPPPPSLPYSKPISLSRLQANLLFADHSHPNTSPPSSFTAKTNPPSLIEPSPTPMKPYQVSSILTHLPLDRQPRLPTLYPPNSLNANDKHKHRNEPDTTLRKPNVCAPTHAPAPPLSSVYCPSVGRPKSSKGLSIVKLLSPIKLPSDNIIVSTSTTTTATPQKAGVASLSSIEPWTEANIVSLSPFDSTQPASDHKNIYNKRPISSIHPRSGMSVKTRLIHCHSPTSSSPPPAPPLSHIVADEKETDGMEKLMTYKRASGEIKVRRGLPIFG